MALIILLACFLSIFLSLGATQTPSANKKELLLTAVLAFSTLVVIITETLSMFKCFNFSFILISWSAILVVSLLYLYSKRTGLSAFNNSLKQKMNEAFKMATMGIKAACAYIFVGSAFNMLYGKY